MFDSQHVATDLPKRAWSAPALECLDVDMASVENGAGPGKDGKGGSTTSLPS